MYGLSKDVNLDIQNYVRQESVRSAALETVKCGRRSYKRYTYYKNGLKYSVGGLTRYLKETFYPHYKAPRRQFTASQSQHKKLASSKARGRRVDRDILRLTVAGTKAPGKKRAAPMPKKRDTLTTAILCYWKHHGFKPVAAQMPVCIPHIGRMTQADVIVEDERGDLYMHEIKTGHVGMHIKKGHMRAPYQDKACNKATLWDLQRHFTAQALIEQGLPLKGSAVIHAYEEQDRKTKVKRAIAVAKPRLKW